MWCHAWITTATKLTSSSRVVSRSSITRSSSRRRPLSSSSSSPGSQQHVWGDIQPKAGSSSAGSNTSSSTTTPSGSGSGSSSSSSGTPRFVRRKPGEAAPAPAAEIDFSKVTGALFDRVEAGVAGMKALNDPFIINRQDEAELVLDLGPGKGAFTLQRDWAQNQLVYMSPVSGCNKYAYDGGEGRWLSVAEDRHDLVGIMTRDLIRMCVGCPQI